MAQQVWRITVIQDSKIVAKFISRNQPSFSNGNLVSFQRHDNGRNVIVQGGMIISEVIDADEMNNTSTGLTPGLFTG